MALDVIKNMIEWDMFKNMIFVNKISDTWESPLIGLWDFVKYDTTILLCSWFYETIPYINIIL